jgi:hypothetical protein
VNGGIFLEASIENKSAGDVVSLASAETLLRIKIQAPLFVDVTEYWVFVDGVEWMHEQVTTHDQIIRLESDIPLTATVDSWVFVAARGQADLKPVSGGYFPIAMTNPIYIDANNDGDFVLP